MPKNKTVTSVKEKRIDLEKEIMSKVTSGQINMKPRWYFVFGSIFSIFGLATLSVALVFLANIVMFLFRKHGRMGQWRLEVMLNDFPMWIPILAIVGIAMGIWLLKKYDFSYKKNFTALIIGFIISIIVAGLIIDRLGLNDIWSRGGMMKKFYQRIEIMERVGPNGSDKGTMQNGRDNVYSGN
jgi:hypothetical protein